MKDTKKKKTKNRNNILKIVIIIFVTILLVFILNYVRINIRYYISKDKYEETFPVYGNTNNYIPQGLTYSDKYNIVLQTSYSKKNNSSKVYVIDFTKEKLINELELLNKNGTKNTKHVGGIATDNDKVWISNDYEIDIYNLDDILNSKGSVKPIEEIKLPIRGDFCYYQNNKLWIGEFYLKPKYDVEDGKPKLYGYDTRNDINFNAPNIIKILPKAVQSMVILPNGDFAFGRSYTYLANSYLSIYKDIPVMKENNKNSNIKLPPMIEGMFIKDDYIYILFESSAKNYSLAEPSLDKVIRYKIDNIK